MERFIACDSILFDCNLARVVINMKLTQTESRKQTRKDTIEISMWNKVIGRFLTTSPKRNNIVKVLRVQGSHISILLGDLLSQSPGNFKGNGCFLHLTCRFEQFTLEKSSASNLILVCIGSTDQMSSASLIIALRGVRENPHGANCRRAVPNTTVIV